MNGLAVFHYFCEAMEKKKQFLYLRILTFISIIKLSNEIAVFQVISFAGELTRDLF